MPIVTLSFLVLNQSILTCFNRYIWFYLWTSFISKHLHLTCVTLLVLLHFPLSFQQCWSTFSKGMKVGCTKWGA